MSVELVGPFRYHAVVIDGRRVPFLTAAPRPGGIVELQIDDRFSIDVPVADLDRVARFVAEGIAVGLGYTAHPDANSEPIRRQPFVRWRSLDDPDASGSTREDREP